LVIDTLCGWAILIIHHSWLDPQSKKNVMLELHMLAGKNIPPIVKNKKVKKGECYGWHSGDVTVLAWQDKKRVTSTYNK
jgi:hypothetical protein